MSTQVVLSCKDKARTRINVFHDTSSNWINLIKELVGNSLDVFNKNETHHISINLLSNTKVEYIDDGCGIPLEGTASNGVPNYQAIFEIDFAGSKYGNTGSTVGQNGVFLWSLAMTCEDFYIEVARPNGKVYCLSYHKGDRLGDLQVIGKSDKTYTKIVFEPDSEVWTNPNYTYEEVSGICEAQASMGNVEIKLTSGDITTVYAYPNGISDYFYSKVSSKKHVSESITFNKKTTQYVEKNSTTYDVDIDMILSFTNDSLDDFKKDFLNTADLIKYGSINKGIISGIKNSVNRWLKNNNKYNKNEKQITDDDIDTGLNYICDVRSNYVEYVSQSKQSTEAQYLKVCIQKAIEDLFEVYIVENPIEIEKIATQILINKRSREKANQTRLNIKSKLTTDGKGVLSAKIEGLKDCDMRKSTVDERILILTEGLSPASTITQSYDNRIMGSLGLKGRFISSLKCSVEDVLNNEPAMSIIRALGCGIEIPYEERKKFKDVQTFDINNLRYGTIAITVDADSWGKAICLSLLAFFKKFFPTLLKQNRVVIVVSPRYILETKSGDFVYVYSEQERDALIEKLGKALSHIGIVKGIGELDAEEFWKYVLCEEARSKTFVTVDYVGDEDEINKKYDMFIGDDIDARKKFIRENIVKVNTDELL